MLKGRNLVKSGIKMKEPKRIFWRLFKIEKGTVGYSHTLFHIQKIFGSLEFCTDGYLFAKVAVKHGFGRTKKW